MFVLFGVCACVRACVRVCVCVCFCLIVVFSGSCLAVCPSYGEEDDDCFACVWFVASMLSVLDCLVFLLVSLVNYVYDGGSSWISLYHHENMPIQF